MPEFLGYQEVWSQLKMVILSWKASGVTCSPLPSTPINLQGQKDGKSWSSWRLANGTLRPRGTWGQETVASRVMLSTDSSSCHTGQLSFHLENLGCVGEPMMTYVYVTLTSSFIMCVNWMFETRRYWLDSNGVCFPFRRTWVVASVGI